MKLARYADVYGDVSDFEIAKIFFTPKNKGFLVTVYLFGA